MTTILIVESNPASGIAAAPEFVDALLLIDPSVKTRTVHPYDAEVTEADLEGIDGAIFTGSGVDWSTDAPEAAPLRAVMERVFDAGVPSYGSCNGMQLAASVLGGSVGASPNGREDGLALDIRLTDAGRAHPFLAGRDDGYAVPCVHRDEVQRLPEGAVLLSGNAHSPVQAFAYERGRIRFWGVQYHPEITPVGIAEIFERLGTGTEAVRADYRAAETDAGAARRLGAAPGDFMPLTRLTEIRNWLASLRG